MARCDVARLEPAGNTRATRTTLANVVSRRHPLATTNDLSSYVGIDVDGARTSLVTSRREATLAVWVGDAKGAEGAEIVPPTSFYGTPRVQWVGERVFYDSEVNGNAHHLQ